MYRNFVTSEKDDFAKFIAEQGMRRLIVLQETLLSHPSLMLPNFETQDCQWCGVKRIKLFFADKRNSGTRFGAHLYYLK